jgi:hypothetical protein
MSDNIVCILGLILFAFCFNAWIVISVMLRKSAATTEEEPTQKSEPQLYMDAIAITDLEQILERRKLTLAQMQVHGDRLSFLYSLPLESQEKIEDYLYGAAHCQNWAIEGYRIREFAFAADFAQHAKERLDDAFNQLNSPHNRGDG